MSFSAFQGASFEAVEVEAGLIKAAGAPLELEVGDVPLLRAADSSIDQQASPTIQPSIDQSPSHEIPGIGTVEVEGAASSSVCESDNGGTILSNSCAPAETINEVDPIQGDPEERSEDAKAPTSQEIHSQTEEQSEPSIHEISASVSDVIKAVQGDLRDGEGEGVEEGHTKCDPSADQAEAAVCHEPLPAIRDIPVETPLVIKMINTPGEQDEDEEGVCRALSQVEADGMIAQLFNEEDISCFLICIEAEARIPSVMNTLRDYAKRFFQFADFITVCITKCDKKGPNWWPNGLLKNKIENAFGLSHVVFWESSTTADQMRSDLIRTDIFSADRPFPRIDADNYFVFFPRNDYNPIKPTIMLKQAQAKYQRLAHLFASMEVALSKQSAQEKARAYTHAYDLLTESLEREKRVFTEECGLQVNSALANGHLRNLEDTILSLFGHLLTSVEAQYQLVPMKMTKRESAWCQRDPVSTCSRCGKVWPAGPFNERSRCGTAEPDDGWEIRDGGYLINPSTLEMLLPFDSPLGCGKVAFKTPVLRSRVITSPSPASPRPQPSPNRKQSPASKQKQPSASATPTKQNPASKQKQKRPSGTPAKTPPKRGGKGKKK